MQLKIKGEAAPEQAGLGRGETYVIRLQASESNASANARVPGCSPVDNGQNWCTRFIFDQHASLHAQMTSAAKNSLPHWLQGYIQQTYMYDT